MHTDVQSKHFLCHCFGTENGQASVLGLTQTIKQAKHKYYSPSTETYMDNSTNIPCQKYILSHHNISKLKSTKNILSLLTCISQRHYMCFIPKYQQYQICNVLLYQYRYETSNGNMSVYNDFFGYMSFLYFGMIGIHTWWNDME